MSGPNAVNSMPLRVAQGQTPLSVLVRRSVPPARIRRKALARNNFVTRGRPLPTTTHLLSGPDATSAVKATSSDTVRVARLGANGVTNQPIFA